MDKKTYKYLITFTPMEPYFFGGERTFGFGKESDRKPPYYIISEKKPSQPTLFGTLRYIILSQNNALFGQKDAAKAGELVGVESFSFQKAMTVLASDAKPIKQNFGIIERISPLFLVKDGDWYVTTPFDHKPGEKQAPNRIYTPFTMQSTPVVFGDGFTLHPSDYKAKEGHGGGYVSLNDQKILFDDDIFISDVRTGINSHRTENTSNGIEDDGSFFKKERYTLKEGISFAVTVELSDIIAKEMKEMSITAVVYMGQDKSAFRCEITKTDKDLVKETEKALGGSGGTHRKYALSDILPVGDSFDGCGCAYYISETAVLRNLESTSYTGNAFGRYKKSEKLYKLMRAGSVFFTEQDFCSNEALQKIGMNILCDLKGENI